MVRLFDLDAMEPISSSEKPNNTESPTTQIVEVKDEPLDESTIIELNYSDDSTDLDEILSEGTPKKKARKEAETITDEQELMLLETFKQTPYITPDEALEIATKVGLEHRTVKNWFTVIVYVA